jgi:hypothetical protein
MGKVPHSHVQASAVQKAEPPRKAGPLITKIEPVEPQVNEVTEAAEVEPESEPVLEPKSFEAAPEAIEPEAAELEAVEAPEAALVEEVPIETIEAPMPVPVEKKASSEETFEQYRQAMLHTGPRDLENQARVEMQSKGGVGNSALWRAQTASLRKSLGHADAAEFLERANMSVNDRVISSFNAYRDA